jgi:hypothetical protein
MRTATPPAILTTASPEVLLLRLDALGPPEVGRLHDIMPALRNQELLHFSSGEGREFCSPETLP